MELNQNPETPVEQSEVEQSEVEQSEVEQSEVEQSEVEQSEVEQSEVEQSEVERLQTEVAALKLALSTAERERDEWRIIAQQCGHLGGEIGEAAKTVEKL